MGPDLQDALQLYTKNDSQHQHLKQLFTFTAQQAKSRQFSTLSGHIMPATGKALQPRRNACLPPLPHQP
jgi:hypothetical protein